MKKVAYPNIAGEMAKKRITNNEMSQYLGITSQTWRRWQTSGDIPASALLKMGKKFGTSIDYLLGISEEQAS